MAVISTLAALLSLGIFSLTSAQDIVFGDPGPSPGAGSTTQPCTTIGGPDAGQPCQLPFIFNDVTRNGCITESDPEGRAWCSTRVDSEGRHVAGGDHWAHCDPECPMSVSASGGQASSAFTVRMSHTLIIYTSQCGQNCNAIICCLNCFRWNRNCAKLNLVRREHADCLQLVSVRRYSSLRTTSVPSLREE